MTTRKIDFAKVMLCAFDADSRSKRECEVVKNLGFDVTIYDNSDKPSKYNNDYRFISKVVKFQGGLFSRAVEFVRWARTIRSGDHNVISAYDISALLICWLSNIGKPRHKKSLLVYDSHEFEFGRNTERPKWVSYLVVKFERFLIRRCYQSIMVNETIALEVKKLHDLPVTPIVCRNIAPLTTVDDNVCRKRRDEMLTSARKSSQTRVIMYHGGVVPGRGIEKIIDCLPYFEDVLFVVLGDGKSDYLSDLKSKVNFMGQSGNVLFIPAVPIGILWQYVGAADVGMVNIENASLSYYYSLPNKLFENVQAETPVVGSNFPEIAKIVEGYRIGLVCKSDSTKEIVFTVNNILSDKVLYSTLKENLKEAKHVLCWENEKNILVNFYQEMQSNLKKNHDRN